MYDLLEQWSCVVNRLMTAVARLLLTTINADANNTTLSPFDDSEECRSYSSRFSPLTLLVNPLDNKKTLSTTVEEGQLNGRVFKRPEDTSDFDIYKSYLSTLESSGFDSLLASTSA